MKKVYISVALTVIVLVSILYFSGFLISSVPLEETAKTQVKIDTFSFNLPQSWHFEISTSVDGSNHIFIQKDSIVPGFVIDCPPPGKGLEAATSLGIKQREFINNQSLYEISLSKIISPGNTDRLFIFVTPKNNNGLGCLVEGVLNSDIETAMSEVYESWK